MEKAPKSIIQKREEYYQYRVRMLPIQLENAYRKVESLQREARRMGMHNLIREIRP